MSLVSDLSNRFKTEFVAQVVSVLSGGLLVVVLTRLLSTDGYGLLHLSISVFGVAGFFSRLGIAKATARHVIKYREQDPSQLPHIIQFSFLLILGTVTVTAVALFGSRRFIANFLKEPELIPLLAAGCFFVSFKTLINYTRRVFQGFEEIQVAAGLRAVRDGARVLLAIGLTALGYGVIGALTGYIVSFGVTAVIGLWYLYVNHYKGLKSGVIEHGLRRRIVEYAVPLTATDSANLLENRIDTVMLGFFIGPVAVAYYTISKQVIQFVKTPISSLGFTLAPTYEAQVAKGNPDTAARLYEKALSYGLLLYIPAAAGLIIVAEPMITLIFGDDYSGAVPVLQIMAIWAVFRSVSQVTSNGLDYLGQAKTRAILLISTSILNFLLNILLIPRMGVLGAAVATNITAALYTVGCLYLIHYELGLRLKWLFRHIILILTITLIMSAIVSQIGGYASGITSLLLITVLGVVIWFVLSLALGLIDMKIINQLLNEER